MSPPSTLSSAALRFHRFRSIAVPATMPGRSASRIGPTGWRTPQPAWRGGCACLGEHSNCPRQSLYSAVGDFGCGPCALTGNCGAFSWQLCGNCQCSRPSCCSAAAAARRSRCARDTAAEQPEFRPDQCRGRDHRKPGLRRARRPATFRPSNLCCRTTRPSSSMCRPAPMSAGGAIATPANRSPARWSGWDRAYVVPGTTIDANL